MTPRSTTSASRSRRTIAGRARCATQFERALSLRLMAALGTDDVALSRGGRAAASTLSVQLNVLAFEPDASRQARLDAFWKVKSGQQQRGRGAGRASLREPIGSGGTPRPSQRSTARSPSSPTPSPATCARARSAVIADGTRGSPASPSCCAVASAGPEASARRRRRAWSAATALRVAKVDGVKRRGVCDLDEAVNRRCRFGLVVGGQRRERRDGDSAVASSPPPTASAGCCAAGDPVCRVPGPGY